ncbi:serine/threonine-protein phosphatase 4 regulatory subunit 3B-like [Octodon degus]|uniref:Serine/threonine-protein phosphatase 4 regulatory subunit 3B-like n=1 Tax=Octodon degus TaxID=10160 RepID=A0A6P3F848_OCTDE|nr:serine/threonine-protein phosphatase 4 regulatory subunit 3B-like [Octodon degus]
MAGGQHPVKLFVMNGDGGWDCAGKGQVSTIYIERLEGMCLLVQSESDDSVILESKINLDTLYQKKRGTLIVWTDAENVNKALSFQHSESCQEIWEEICQVQGKDPTEEITQYGLDETGQFDEILEDSNIESPDCELSTVADLADFFNSFFVSPNRKERLIRILENGGYLKKLLELFQICENMHDTEALHHLYNIVKGVLLLDKTSLFEIMFSDECIMDVIGCLEYDPALAQPEKHREFITQSAKFKEIVPITNSEVKKKIHQTYRVKYIRDMLLSTRTPREENFLPSLTNFIFLNKTDIVSMLQEDDTFFSEVFTQLKDKTMADDKRLELLIFFKEFCEFSQALYPQSKDTLLKKFVRLGILPVLKNVMSVDDFQVKQAATAIFACLVEYNPSIIRQFAMDEDQECKDDELLINVVIEQMICDTDPELSGAMNLMAPLCSLLDPETMLISSYEYERSKFLNFFYNHCMHNLTAPLLSTTEKDKEDDGFGPDQNRNCPSVVRLMRKMIGLKDPQYNHYIIRGNLFEPIVNAFLANGTRYNILNSAIIELFEYINVENIKSLTVHVVKKFYKAFESIEYVQTFKNLKSKYEQQKDQQSQVKQTLHSTAYRDTKHMTVKKEICFNIDTREEAMLPVGNDPDGDENLMESKSTEENENNVGPPKITSSSVVRVASAFSGGAGDGLSSPCSSSVTTLVDYPDDDNNEEHREDKPPPTKRPNQSS